MSKVIEVKELVREYEIKKKGSTEKKIAVNNVTFDVEEGEVFGLLGPNGAGKSTTIKVLTTLLTPSSGSVKIMGLDVEKDFRKIREHINFVFGGEKGVYNRLTTREFLKYFAFLYKVPEPEHESRIESLIKLVNLTDYADNQIHTYSKGTIQRLHMARALISNPKIIFLDEPTIGLDPVIAEQIREIIRELSKNKITVILTTHYLKEADDLCNRIGIINDGVIKILDTPKMIKEQFDVLNIYEATCINVKEEIYENGIFQNLKIKNRELDVQVLRFETEKTISFSDIQSQLNQYAQLLRLEHKEVTLEDAYIRLLKVV
ncbi:ABC transporter ATP-binding protein [Brevibacillus formosus]|uniref:ABC transporter ATP-binding protein n=1 Tax=Brevibacillus formosus TaxID=54913 RepID=UPI0018CE046E|nr:ABC transporter ATP-binding protein [Brevibacillus formosus]MBG9941021.1 daunorubicin ABC transporter ATPase [Brevibacillus formosus]